jgi:hypothetical protein
VLTQYVLVGLVLAGYGKLGAAGISRCGRDRFVQRSNVTDEVACTTRPWMCDGAAR